jgi:hypothetical protein
MSSLLEYPLKAVAHKILLLTGSLAVANILKKEGNEVCLNRPEAMGR